MNEDPIEISDERIPDFTWPDHIAEFLSEWLSAQWKTLVEEYAAGFFRRRIPRVACKLLSGRASSTSGFSGFAYATFTIQSARMVSGTS